MFRIIHFFFLIIVGVNLCCCIDEAWYSYQSSVRNANREELVITNVTAERSYAVNFNVRRWKSLTIGLTCYSVGLLETGLNIIITELDQNRTGFAVGGPGEMDLKEKPSDVILFHNRNNGRSEAVLVVSFVENSDLLWIKLTPSKMVVNFWTWYMEEPIVHINWWNMQGRQIMFVVTNDTRAYMYEFDIKSENPTYWYLQSIHLTTSTKSSAFSSFNSDYFLAIPQTSLNSVLIYKYTDNHFIHQDTIKSPKVTAVTPFEIGFKSFLAVDGYNAGIYEFTKDGLIERRMVNSHSEGIHYWLPVPIQTYRDEVILFAQRAIDHGTHKALAVEIIVYNGGQFEEHEDVPCTLFEEHSLWLTCLTHDNGIDGASFLAIGDKLGLIVSKPSNSSFVTFMIHSTLKPMPHPKKNEIDLLYEQKDRIQELIHGQMKNFEELVEIKSKQVHDMTDSLKIEEQIVGDPEEDVSKYEEEIIALGVNVDEAMKKIKDIKEKENQTDFDTIIVNGIMRIPKNLEVLRVEIVEVNESPATDMLKDIVRKDELNKLLKNKTFTDLEVDDLNFEEMNGINASQITYKDDNTVLRGDIVFEKPVIINETSVITGKVNDLDLINEVIDMGKRHSGNLEFEEIVVTDNIQTKKLNNFNLLSTNITSSDEGTNETEISFIPQNITVTTINGVDFSNLTSDLCLSNVKCYIPGNITITGNVTVEDMYTNYLDELKFPEEFLLSDSVLHATVTGKKTFENILRAIEIRTEGTVGGVDTNKLITLSSDQIVPGKLKFKHLELTEELNVTGKILGEHVSEFVPNPTLKETDLIKSNVNFRRLEVEGNITLDNNLNAFNYEEILRNLIYLDEDIANVTGPKVFLKGLAVQGNLDIGSNAINNVNLDSLVLKDSDQNLQMNFLKGAVSIHDLQVSGTYDGVNIAQFDESLVKLTGEQFIASTLIFTEDVVVENLEITEKLNELKAEEYFYSSGDVEVPQNVSFDNIVVQILLVQGNLSAVFPDFDLADFNKRYLSFTKNQSIDALFHLGSSEVDNLQVITVNGSDFGKLFNQTRFSDIIKNMLNNGTSKVENLKVDGSIHIKRANNKIIDDIISRNPLKTQDGKMKKELIFENDIYFNEIEIDTLSSVGWNMFVSNIVFKNETTLNMTGTKNFRNGIVVDQLVETEKFNDILLDNILTREGNQDIRGPLIIIGNVTIQDSTVLTKINETPIKDILSAMNVSNGICTVNGDMLFERVAHIEDLIVNGMVNNKIPDQLLDTIVYKNSDAVMNNKIIFRKLVNVSGDLEVNFFNKMNLSHMKSIVLTSTDADIIGLVSFSKPVVIQEQMRVEGNFIADLLSGINSDGWVNKAIFIDQGLLIGNYTFEEIVVNEELITAFINDIDMRNIIPLRSNQNIDFLEIDEVTAVKNISVGNLVNGFKLSPAFENTMMGNLDQNINSDIIFTNSILVRQVLTSPTINGFIASKIVTTNSDQNLTSALNFRSKCVIESDLKVHGLINKINLNSWKNGNLRLFSNRSQDVTDKWNVAKNLSFSNDVSGNITIGGLDLLHIAEEVAERREYKYKFEKGIIDDYINICTDVTYLFEKAKTQIYKFKYFDDFQELSFQHNIRHVFYFEHKSYHYLLVNENNCSSHLLGFNGTGFHPLIDNIVTGSIEQVVRVFDEDNIFLVIRGVSRDPNCGIVGTNIWKLSENSLDMVMNMEDQILLQESLVPSTFYAMNDEGVIEYKLKNGFEGYKKYRKWNILEENVAFMPRGLRTGLALRTGKQIIYLDQSDPVLEEDTNNNLEVTIRGESRSIDNDFIPGKNGSDMVVMRVGMKSARKSLLAVATHEETIIKTRLDFVKVYGDAIKGEIFDKVPTYKPSSLLSVEFNQGETLLVFLENRRLLQVYEYKGIEGFKHRSSVKIPGSKIFQMTLPAEVSNERKVIGVIYENKIRLLEAVMDGNEIKSDLKCGL